MRILLAHNFYRSEQPSGEDVVFRNELRLLLEHGIDALSFTRHNDSLGTGMAGNLRGLAALFGSRQVHADLRETLVRTRPDLVHIHNGFPQILGPAVDVCRELRLPLVMTLHNYRLICANGLLLRHGAPCERCIGHALHNAVLHACYRNSRPASAAVALATALGRNDLHRDNTVARFIALTQAARNRFVRAGIAANRMVVRGNALPWDPGVGANRQPYFLFVGRLTAEKGVRTLIQAWNRVEGVTLKIVGDGDLRQELEASSRSLPVEFLGQRPHEDVIGLLKSARALILPSECYEGFPMTVVEAIATGTPLILADDISLAGDLTHGQNALMFRTRDTAALADAILRLATDGQLREHMQRRNRELYEAQFSARRAYESLMNIYEDVLGDLSTPAPLPAGAA